MQLKYVRFVCPNGNDSIITFPRHMNHDETIRRIRHIEVVSAGFVDSQFNCFGRSESLGLDSIPDQDTKLMIRHFRHGC